MSTTLVCAFAFGQPSSTRVNLYLASVAEKVAHDKTAPVYTQADIAIPPNGDCSFEVFYFLEEEGNPPPTLRLARWVAAQAQERGVERIIVIAAAPHLFRAWRDVYRACKERRLAIFIEVPAELEDNPRDWFSPESSQERVHSWWKWWRREILLRMMPFWLYSRVAS